MATTALRDLMSEILGRSVPAADIEDTVAEARHTVRHHHQRLLDLIDWHETKAMKLRTFPPANEDIGISKARVHEEAAAKLKQLLL